MKKQRDTTQEDFDWLLSWLDEDREEAGKKYEIIRRRLIKIFTCRCCADAEDLADETISRVTEKVPEIARTYEGDQRTAPIGPFISKKVPFVYSWLPFACVPAYDAPPKIYPKE